MSFIDSKRGSKGRAWTLPLDFKVLFWCLPLLPPSIPRVGTHLMAMFTVYDIPPTPWTFSLGLRRAVVCVSYESAGQVSNPHPGVGVQFTQLSFSLSGRSIKGELDTWRNLLRKLRCGNPGLHIDTCPRETGFYNSSSQAQGPMWRCSEKDLLAEISRSAVHYACELGNTQQENISICLIFF